MVKAYNDWLNERSMQTPLSLEIQAGDVKVFADPQAENWMGETVRVEQYEKLKTELEQAIKKEDDDQIRALLSTAKDLPLFAQDKSQVWKMSQVEGIEKFRTEIEHRTFLAAYAAKKIAYFLDWVRNTQGKKTK
jgi:hypothetical protein